MISNNPSVHVFPIVSLGRICLRSTWLFFNNHFLSTFLLLLYCQDKLTTGTKKAKDKYIYFEPPVFFLPRCSYHIRQAPIVEYQWCHHLGQNHMRILCFHKNSSSHGNSQNLRFWFFSLYFGMHRKNWWKRLVCCFNSVCKVSKFEIYNLAFSFTSQHWWIIHTT